MKILPVVTELFHADRRTEIYDKASSLFPKFCVSAYKTVSKTWLCKFYKTLTNSMEQSPS